MRREIVVLEDDIDGGKADETVQYTVDGVTYEIDLSQKNANKLRDALSPFVTHSRKIGRGALSTVGGRRTQVPARGMAARRRENEEIRTWAKEKGYSVQDRGRIPRQIEDEYFQEKAPGLKDIGRRQTASAARGVITGKTPAFSGT